MKCPSCAHPNDNGVKYCARCRMSFSKINLAFSNFRVDLTWILRRANAGFVSGLIAWFFIPIVTRILQQSNDPVFYMPITGMMGGAFLGCVDGMVEDSTPKTIRGAIMGGLGGLLGGYLFVFLSNQLSTDRVFLQLFLFWAVAGAFIGLVSALWESQPKKLAAGIISGFIGGGVGGYLGTAVHANLVQQLNPESWLVQRFFESLIGGIIGVSLWFFLGTAERFFIFKRRLINDSNHKECDQCNAKNPLSSWYCGRCGSVLQVSAPSAKLNLPPFMTLYRVSEMCQFLSRLAAITGFIAGFVSLFIFLPGDPFVVVVALVLIALISYAFQVLFSAFSEALKVFIN